MAVYWYREILRKHLEGVLGFTWAPGFLLPGPLYADRRKSVWSKSIEGMADLVAIE